MASRRQHSKRPMHLCGSDGVSIGEVATAGRRRDITRTKDDRNADGETPSLRSILCAKFVSPGCFPEKRDYCK